ncbi:pirin family protein [Agrilutibacter solisilvae]|uniref:pirin family protein n=1 Tax=Agrilutibacter solisilvae TaxID=2763317 RepID=UPI001FD64360|nr:pirin family protein [Lysobacter solisilvae]
MILDRPAGARGESRADWLESRHAFSFSRYYDPAWMGFGPLRVINEDVVAPGAGFEPHRHANMEILSYVLDGELSHRDDSGGGGVIRAGELQWMGAGHGIEHSEFNASPTRPVHFLQVWIQPDRLNATPAYAQRAAASTPGWTLMASPDGAQESLAIRQDACLWLARPCPGEVMGVQLLPTRRYWLQVARGRVRFAGRELNAGDAVGLVEESGEPELRALQDSEVLFFDLPL